MTQSNIAVVIFRIWPEAIGAIHHGLFGQSEEKIYDHAYYFEVSHSRTSAGSIDLRFKPFSFTEKLPAKSTLGTYVGLLIVDFILLKKNERALSNNCTYPLHLFPARIFFISKCY